MLASVASPELVLLTVRETAMRAGATAGESVWQLPALRHDGSETIRETAERTAAATLPDGLKVPSIHVHPASYDLLPICACRALWAARAITSS